MAGHERDARARPAARIALLGVALILAAGLFDGEPLYAPGVALLLLGTVVPLWVWLAGRRAGVRRTVEARRVMEGEPVEVVLDVAMAPGVPSPGGVIHDPIVPRPLPLPRLRFVAGEGGRSRLRLNVRFERRGRRRLDPPWLELRDPLGLARAVVRAPAPKTSVWDAGGLRRGSSLPTGAPAEILVLPRLHPVRAAGDDGGQSGLGRTPILAAAAEIELDGLRPYRPGAPASRIHWPALARGAGLIERRLRAESDARPLVILDARAPERVEDLDAAVRAATSLIHALAAEGGCAVLLPGDRRATLLDADGSSWAAMHARLALVEAGGAPPAALGGARQGALIYIPARRTDRLPPALVTAARGARVLVVPGALPDRRAAFTVAGCTGYVLRAAAPVAAPPSLVGERRG
ncbi:MAG TPA: DUF58 domain-containing protein [Solirubrobacteraceae bacterium]